MAARDLLKAGLRKTIGNGQSTKAWSKSWLPTTPPRPPRDNGSFQDPYLLVSHLIDSDTSTWRTDILQVLLDQMMFAKLRALR